MNKKAVNITILLLLAVFILFRVNTALKQMNRSEQGESQKIENTPAVFSGVMPCADCSGIEYTLVLEDQRFIEWSHYRDRDQNLFDIRGSWRLSGDTLKLLRDGDDLHKAFLFSQNQIDMLDRDLQLISNETDEQYSFRRSSKAESIYRRHMELSNLGIHFVASGNEPFWSIHLSSDSLVTYMTPDAEYTFPDIEPVPAESAPPSLRAVQGGNSIEININTGHCRDSMSDFLFTHRVEVQFNNQQPVNGCGRYL